MCDFDPILGTRLLDGPTGSTTGLSGTLPARVGLLQGSIASLLEGPTLMMRSMTALSGPLSASGGLHGSGAQARQESQAERRQ